MINLKLILYGIVVAAILSAGLYIRHLHKEAQRVPNLVQTINALNQQRNAEREANRIALEKESELQKQLASARGLNAALAARLRRALADELSQAPADPTESPGASGDGGSTGVFDSINRVIAACQRDSIRLNGWREYYDGLPPELK